MTNEKFVCEMTIEGAKVVSTKIDGGKLVCEMTIDGVEILNTVVVDGKEYIKELLIDGVKVVRTADTKNEFIIEQNGFIWKVSPYHKDIVYELVKELKEDVKDFLAAHSDCVKVPDTYLYKYLTLGDLRELLKDLPDDTLMVGMDDCLVQCIRVGYITEKVKTYHDLAGGADYDIRRFFMKDKDLVFGWINADNYNYPADEEFLLKQANETKDAVRNFIKNRDKDERVGVRLD